MIYKTSIQIDRSSWKTLKLNTEITESNVRQLGAEALAGKSQRACFAATDKSEGGWEKYDTINENVLRASLGKIPGSFINLLGLSVINYKEITDHLI